MKICFVAPGELPIPPQGWGALETAVYCLSAELSKLGVKTCFVNEKTPEATIEKIINLNPDILHLNLGKHWEIMPMFSIPKIVTSYDGSFPASKTFHEQIIRRYLRDCNFFCITEIEKKFLSGIGLRSSRVKKLPSGVSTASFRVANTPKFNDKSICIGKIDHRKRQATLQKMNLDIDFVGHSTIPDFDTTSNNYLGPWSREDIFSKLTDYTNLVLLSESELQPFVCMEALSAGLGLVISEACTENLDLSKPFITVIPEEKVMNKEYVKEAISNNRYLSTLHRPEIIKYAKTFDWSETAKKYISYL